MSLNYVTQQTARKLEVHRARPPMELPAGPDHEHASSVDRKDISVVVSLISVQGIFGCSISFTLSLPERRHWWCAKAQELWGRGRRRLVKYELLQVW